MFKLYSGLVVVVGCLEILMEVSIDGTETVAGNTINFPGDWVSAGIIQGTGRN